MARTHVRLARRRFAALLDRIDTVFAGISRPTQFAACLALVVVLGAIDRGSGYEGSWAVFYLAPVSLAAWYIGSTAGTLIAGAAAITWLTVDMAAQVRYTNAVIPVWNATSRLAFFLITAHLIAKVRQLLLHDGGEQDRDGDDVAHHRQGHVPDALPPVGAVQVRRFVEVDGDVLIWPELPRGETRLVSALHGDAACPCPVHAMRLGFIWIHILFPDARPANVLDGALCPIPDAHERPRRTDVDDEDRSFGQEDMCDGCRESWRHDVVRDRLLDHHGIAVAATDDVAVLMKRVEEGAVAAVDFKHTRARADVDPHPALGDRGGNPVHDLVFGVRLERVVVTQSNAYQLDNGALLEALIQLGTTSARGVAAVAPGTPGATLRQWHEKGVRGARIMNLPKGAVTHREMPEVERLIRPLGWHLMVQFNGRHLGDYLEGLRRLEGNYVIDHIGKFMPPVPAHDRRVDAILRLLDRGNAWFKICGGYEVSMSGGPRYEDVGAIARRVIAHAPERVIWGSNWPHVGVPREQYPDDAEQLDVLLEWASPEAGRKILVDNPAALYGF